MIENGAPASELLRLSIARQRALYGPEQEGCRILQQLQSMAEGDGDVGASFEVMLADLATYRATLAWQAQNMLGEFEPGIRRRVLEAVAENDPPTACRIYMRDPTLTDEEDAILWAGFAPKMSTMRLAFEEGRCKRAKGAAPDG